MARQLTVDAPVAGRSVPSSRASDAPEPVGLLRRAWGAPLWAHAVALAVVLVALVPLVGPDSSFSADEGAAIVQARHLARGQGWIVDHPVPRADPTGRNYPLELSARGPKGVAPFAKHPLYALVLAAADRTGGVAAMVVLSLAGTVAAAALAAALARRLDEALVRPTLWAVGIASPLLFDGYLVIAHTLGAAAGVGAVVCALRAVEGRRPVPALAGVAGWMAVAVLLRNEAVFLALGLAVAVAAVAVRRRSRLAAGVAFVAVAVAALAHVGEQAWIRHIVGAAPYPNGAPGGSTGLSGRIEAFIFTWLHPAVGGTRLLEMLLVVMLAALVLASFAARRHPADGGVVIGVSAVAAGAAVGAALLFPAKVVPGLLIAFPLLGAGLVAVRADTVRCLTGRLALATFCVFALGVIATQYASGGSGEWGGRYFALGLPIVVPVVLLALRNAGRCLEPRVRQVVACALVVCSLAMAVMAIGSLRSTHRYTKDLVAGVDRAVRASGLARPVLIATSGLLPRNVWPTFDRQRWLLAETGDLAGLVDRLRAVGERQAILVSGRSHDDLAALGPNVQLESRTETSPGSGWQVVVLRTGP